MSGITRFLSKREGKRDREREHNHHFHKKAPSVPGPETTTNPIDPNSSADFYGLFLSHSTPADNAEEEKIKTLRQRLIRSKGVMLRDSQILWALHSISSGGDVDAAYGLLLALSDASEGIVTSFDPRVKLLGAQNRQGVTCFLDSTLFSMFSRLDSFEAMLYNTFDDLPRNKLGFVLRLWVNLLRSGRLITTDITKVLQATLAECGWAEAAELHQQDASEAFSFITGKLELPLLTLKMDIYHTGKEDSSDDHKFINERLLEVAIPAETTDEKHEIKLEDCLEDYFNNRIEVRRYMERRSTLNSVRKGGNSVHVETVELDADASPLTPIASSPLSLAAPPPSIPAVTPIPPRLGNRHRTPSIIQERYVPSRNDSGLQSLHAVETTSSAGRSRAGSFRKEVMMPAWQFFSLIPWYTDNAPTSDAQVAAHFSSKRPVLGLCLKRYTFTKEGMAVRNGTQVDIPVEIGVPHFIQDDNVENLEAFHGNFKLSLQSAVCHRGNSVDSGHYIALVRGVAPPASQDGPIVDSKSTWMRFDDLAPQRITTVDIEKALVEETPYLLFYQIKPIDGDPGDIARDEGNVFGSVSDQNASQSDVSLLGSPQYPPEPNPPSSRFSFELPVRDDGRGRSPAETRRASAVSFTEKTPEKPSSNNSEGRLGQRLGEAGSLGRTLSKLAKRKSKDPMPGINVSQTEILVKEVSGDTPTPSERGDEAPRGNSLQVQGHTTAAKPLKREKSKGRMSRSRVRAEKPDRECVVM